MFYTTLTEEQRLEKAMIRLMAEPRLSALCGVMMIGAKHVCDKTPTACTNGRDEKYGRRFVRTLSDPQLRAVVMHEVGHKMMRHLITWRHLWERDPDRANRAADYVVNQWVDDEIKAGVNAQFWTTPAPLLDPQFKGMNVQQVFNLLSAGQDGDADLGDHDWDDAKDMSEQQQRQLTEDIDSAMRQGAMAASKSGSPTNKFVDELLRSQVNWRDGLREFLSELCSGSDYTTWARPSRRYLGADLIMPSGVSEKSGQLVVAIDTSGSIDAKSMGQFLGELQGLCEQLQPSSVRLLYWDTKVRADEQYDADSYDSLVHSTKPAGGGGTDAACIPQYIIEHALDPQAVVVITDGWVHSWGQWAHPLLWCVVGSKRRPPVGKVVYVE